MIVDVAAILVAIAFAVLVGYLVPLLIQIRKMVAESEQLVTKLNVELPTLITELRATPPDAGRGCCCWMSNSAG